MRTLIIALFIVLMSQVCFAPYDTEIMSNNIMGRGGQNNVKIVQPEDDLQKAYDWLKSSQRDEQMGAVAINHPRTLLLSPGVYTGTVDLDTDYVNIASFVPGTVTFTGNINQSADNAKFLIYGEQQLENRYVWQERRGVIGDVTLPSKCYLVATNNTPPTCYYYQNGYVWEWDGSKVSRRGVVSGWVLSNLWYQASTGNLISFALEGGSGRKIKVSTNDGLTFTDKKTLALSTNGSLKRSFCDVGSHGLLYADYADDDANSVIYASVDDGATWNSVLTVNDVAGDNAVRHIHGIRYFSDGTNTVLLIFTGDDNSQSSVLVCRTAAEIDDFIGGTNQATWKTRWGLNSTTRNPNTSYCLNSNLNASGTPTSQQFRWVDCLLIREADDNLYAYAGTDSDSISAATDAAVYSYNLTSWLAGNGLNTRYLGKTNGEIFYWENMPVAGRNVPVLTTATYSARPLFDGYAKIYNISDDRTRINELARWQITSSGNPRIDSGGYIPFIDAWYFSVNDLENPEYADGIYGKLSLAEDAFAEGQNVYTAVSADCNRVQGVNKINLLPNAYFVKTCPAGVVGWTPANAYTSRDTGTVEPGLTYSLKVDPFNVSGKAVCTLPEKAYVNLSYKSLSFSVRIYLPTTMYATQSPSVTLYGYGTAGNDMDTVTFTAADGDNDWHTVNLSVTPRGYVTNAFVYMCATGATYNASDTNIYFSRPVLTAGGLPAVEGTISIQDAYNPVFQTTIVPVTSLREVDGAAENIPTTASGSGILSSDTTPVLRYMTPGATNNNSILVVEWAASDQTPIVGSIWLPYLIRDAGITIMIRCASSGTTNKAGFDLDLYGLESQTATISKSVEQGTASATFEVLTADVLAVETLSNTTLLGFEITPKAHTTDKMYITGIAVKWLPTD